MLYKIAAKKKKRKVGTFDALATAAGTTMVGGTASGLAAHGLLAISPKEELSEKEIDQLYRSIGGKKKLSVQNTVFGLAFGRGEEDLKNKLVVIREATLDGNAGYIPRHFSGADYDAIIVPTETNRAMVSHEMGHSLSPFTNSKAGFAVYAASKGLGFLSPLVAAKRLNDAYNRGASKEEIEKIKMQNNIGAFLTFSPVIGEETYANFKALQALRRTGHLNARNILPVVASELSYLSVPMLTPLTHKAIDWIHQDKH